MTGFSQGTGQSATSLQSSITYSDIIIVVVIIIITITTISIIIISLLILHFPCVSSENLGAANQYIQRSVKHRANYTTALPEEGCADA